MIDKQKHPAVDAMAVYEKLAVILQPVCERITYAGSLRRGKAMVGDLELLLIPKIALESNPDSLLPELHEVNLTDRLIDSLVSSGLLGKRINSRGSATWGPQNKLAIHLPSKIPVDIFSEPDPRCWFRSLVIRTGGKETNLSLTMGAKAMKRTLHAYGSRCCEYSDGTVLVPATESEVFEFCGQKYRLPKDR